MPLSQAQRLAHAAFDSGEPYSRRNSPGITQMRVFDLARRETLWVGEDTGAWIPQNPSQILARAAWDSVEP